MTKMAVRSTARKPRKNKSETRGGMKPRPPVSAARKAGANTDRKARLLTMHATAGGLTLTLKDGAKAKATVQTSGRSRRFNMSSGNEIAPTRDAGAEARAKVVAIARAAIHNNSDVREAFAAVGAVLLTVILDDGKESVEWELDAGDWILLRVSDYADVMGRGQGDLFPVAAVQDGNGQ